MSLPVVVLYSRNYELLSQLPTQLEGLCSLIMCDSVDDAQELCPRYKPNTFVADVRHVQNGGGAEEKLLSDVTRTLPKSEVILTTSPESPANLRAKQSEDHFQHIPDFQKVEDLVKMLLISDDDFDTKQFPELNDTPQTPPPAEPVVRERDNPLTHDKSAVVLTGLTRQFATNSTQLKQMLAELEIAARHNVTILLIGETGSGKTFLSKLIHEISPRREAPFLHVACGALPSELIESEMFGHAKGAFTSAHVEKEGKFVAAGQGTILLDEIDVLGPEQQVKLLRVIETGEFEAVGSNRTLRSQARLVVASNLNLQPLVEQGRFRPDLYYRLNMLKFEIPPLRQRKADIIPLARKFVKQMAEKHRIEITHIDDELLMSLLSYPWPGNVRELENVIQRAVIYCTEGVLRASHLPSHVINGEVGPSNDPSVSMSSTQNRLSSLNEQVSLTEREIIEQVLVRNNQSRTNTAKELGISRVTLYNKMKKYGMSK
ncbi:MAG: sigma-54 dependent transcriptional regulator [Planctomycetota bacterium]|nr:sigma-54 dependent transcriptional regulator [Planctomycetota bacterium]MDA1211656.1 sigma-54 dependent transcriptional regulator [Planctomycetota bacterium]